MRFLPIHWIFILFCAVNFIEGKAVEKLQNKTERTAEEAVAGENEELKKEVARTKLKTLEALADKDAEQISTLQKMLQGQNILLDLDEAVDEATTEDKLNTVKEKIKVKIMELRAILNPNKASSASVSDLLPQSNIESSTAARKKLKADDEAVVADKMEAEAKATLEAGEKDIEVKKNKESEAKNKEAEAKNKEAEAKSAAEESTKKVEETKKVDAVAKAELKVAEAKGDKNVVAEKKKAAEKATAALADAEKKAAELKFAAEGQKNAIEELKQAAAKATEAVIEAERTEAEAKSAAQAAAKESEEKKKAAADAAAAAEAVQKKEEEAAAANESNAATEAEKEKEKPEEKAADSGGADQGGLAAHNKKRALHGAPPLIINSKLMADAQKWAESMATKGQMAHDSGANRRKGYDEAIGENLAYGCGTGKIDIPEAVEMWWHEVCDPGYTWPGADSASYGVLHFTQVVWKKTKEMGIGIATGQAYGMECTWVAARYNAMGNMGKQYVANVGKGTFDKATHCKSKKRENAPGKSKQGVGEGLTQSDGDLKKEIEQKLRGFYRSANTTEQNEGIQNE